MITKTRMLDNQYGPAIAKKAAEALKFINKGNLKYAKKRINTLAKNTEANEVPNWLWSRYHAQTGDISQAEQSLLLCVKSAADFYLAEYFAFCAQYNRENSSLKTLAPIVNDQWGAVIPAIDQVIASGKGSSNLCILQCNLLKQLGRFDDAIRCTLLLPVEIRQDQIAELLLQTKTLSPSTALDSEICRLLANNIDLQGAVFTLVLHPVNTPPILAR